ncbi:hypothetical protein TELCIR_08873 [Teladorsagia circumcincta]|uniref:Uncharacterized protein n=1 Tax=Teladorsagia circumcincta TaxID=45464 RepID=A0A2G9UGE7_TELCI|nr:hypothetical protein TELCIR_08873 [Teladorsagia circumcincta]
MLFFSSRSRLQHGLSFRNYLGEIFENIRGFFTIHMCDSEEEQKPCEGTEFASDATVIATNSCQCVKHKHQS